MHETMAFKGINSEFLLHSGGPVNIQYIHDKIKTKSIMEKM